MNVYLAQFKTNGVAQSGLMLSFSTETALATIKRNFPAAVISTAAEYEAPVTRDYGIKPYSRTPYPRQGLFA